MKLPPLDILMIAPTPFFENRGCHFRIKEEAKALQGAGKTVLIATFGQGEEVKGLDISRSTLDLITFENGPTASWKKIPALIFLFFTVLRLIFKNRPKVIYCHLLEGLAVGLKAFFIAKIVSFWSYRPLLIFDTQGNRAEEMKSYGMTSNRWLLDIFNGLEKFLLRFPDRIFVSSLNYLKKLEESPELKNKIEQLTDGPSFKPRKSPADQKEKISSLSKVEKYFSAEDYLKIKNWLNESKFITIYTGSFDRSKGLSDFIEKNLSRFSEKNKVRFIFAGSGQIQRKDSEIVAWTQKLNDKNLKTILSLANLGIDPKPKTSTESSGKIINYMAAGLPVLALKNPNNFLFAGEDNFLTNKIEDFQIKIVKIVDDPDLTRSIGIKNISRINKNFAWDLQIRKILAIISHR